MTAGNTGKRDSVLQPFGWILSVFFGAALLLPASLLSQAGRSVKTRSEKTSTSQKGSGASASFQETSFPGIKQAGNLPNKAGDVPREKNSKQKDAADGVAQAPLELMQTTADLPLRKSRSLGVTPFSKDGLKKGTLVWRLAVDPVAKSSKVAILGGLDGYVFAKYIELAPDGYGRIKGSNVNFRHQARATTFPVDVTKAGMRLKLLARHGDWWKVLSNDEIGVWVPSSGLELLARVKADGENPHERIAGEALRLRAQKQIEERERHWVAGIATRKAEATSRQDLADLNRALGDFRTEYEKLMSDMAGDPDLEALKKIEPLLGKIVTRAAELQAAQESVGGRIAMMGKEFKHSVLLAKSKLVVDVQVGRDKRDQVNVAVATAAIPSFTGWLVYRPGQRHYSDYQLVKGNKTLCYLTCNSMRYELGDFVDRRISIRADSRFVAAADFKVADIKKLLVLSKGN